MHIFAIVASPDFALLYKIPVYPPRLKKPLTTPIDFIQIVPIKKATKVAVINADQVAVYSKIDLVVVNINNLTPREELGNSKVEISEIDFKLKFHNPI
jgi:hypothetical protein